MAEYAQRMESFPFDSSPDVEYDEDGYPIYDRAVGAEAMRRTFEKYFSDGVFPNPAEEMEVSAGDSGLTVKVAPGTCIIKGSMGTLLEEVTLTLDTAVQGNTVYGVMAAFDNNEDRRSVYLRVAKGTPGTNQPPEPDRTTPNIYEYRIADVTLNSGATSVSAANVKNNKGTAAWPYAAPFEEIDVDGIVTDFRKQANVALEDLQELFDTYKDLIESALDETTAGLLQTQIEEIKKQLENFDLSGSVDDETIKYGAKPGTVGDRLYIPDGAVTTGLIADGAVTTDKVSEDLVEMITKPRVGKDLGAYSWDELIQMAQDPEVGADGLAYMIGQTRQVLISGYGSVSFQLVGIMHDDLADGSGKASMTFMAETIMAQHNMNSSSMTSGGWASSEMRTWLNGTVYNAMSSAVKPYIKQVKKPYNTTKGGNPVNSNDHIFLASEKEVFGTQSYDKSGTQYSYWSQNNNATARIKQYGGKNSYWWLRSVGSSAGFAHVSDGGSLDYYGANSNDGVVPCFCI